MKNESADDLARIALLGARYDASVLEATRQIYEPRIDQQPVREMHDVAFGEGDHASADVYLPTEGKAAGLVVFVHGGGFVSGSKNDGVFYANVGRYFAHQGFAVVIPGYRLAPQSGWPAAALDVHAALTWAGEQRVVWGMQPNTPITLFGHSAGATHAASVLFDRGVRPLSPVSLSAAMLLSGLYDDDVPLSVNARAYFGDDSQLHSVRLPARLIGDVEKPIWVGVAQFDSVTTAAQAYRLATALCAKTGRAPSLGWLQGHNHVSTIFSLGSGDETAGASFLQFLRQVA